MPIKAKNLIHWILRQSTLATKAKVHGQNAAAMRAESKAQMKAMKALKVTNEI